MPNPKGTLRVSMLSGGSNFSLVGTDSGSGASMDLSVFQPIVPYGYFYLGQVAVQGKHNACMSACAIVQPVNDVKTEPCLKPATYFLKVWDDSGSHNDNDYSFWQPACEDLNYVAVGTIYVTGRDTNGREPPVRNYPGLMLVRRDLVTYTQCDPTLIWDDKGSGASANASLFAMPSSNYFICSNGPEGERPARGYPDLPPRP